MLHVEERVRVGFVGEDDHGRFPERSAQFAQKREIVRTGTFQTAAQNDHVVAGGREPREQLIGVSDACRHPKPLVCLEPALQPV